MPNTLAPGKNTIAGMFANAKPKNIQKPKRVMSDLESSPDKDNQDKKNIKMKVDNSIQEKDDIKSKFSYDPSKAEKEKAVKTNLGISNCDNQIKLN